MIRTIVYDKKQDKIKTNVAFDEFKDFLKGLHVLNENSNNSFNTIGLLSFYFNRLCPD